MEQRGIGARIIAGLTLAVAGSFGASAAQATPTGWVEQYGTVANEFFGDVRSDSSGNLYVTGGTAGVLGAASLGGNDAFLSKFDKTGNLRWTVQFGSSAADWGQVVLRSSSGDLYVLGGTQGDLAGPNSGGDDMFIAKFDRNGHQKWIRQFGTGTNDYLFDAALGPSGTLYAAAYTAASFDGQTWSGGTDALLIKFDKNGNRLWSREYGSAGNDSANAVAVSAAGEVYIGGGTDGTLPGGSAPMGSTDAFVAKFDKAGTRQWTRVVGTSGYDAVQALAVTANGQVRVGGHANGALGTQVGGQDAWVANYDRAGTQLWLTQFGTTGSDGLQALVVAKNGVAYSVGETLGSVGGFVNAGAADVVVTKIGATGAVTWARQFGSAANDDAEAITLRSSNANGGALVVGSSTFGAFFGQANMGGRDLGMFTLAS